ncbi:MAG: DUF4332 domain-containing protein [Gammaproteobacteria bacterium]
MSYLISQILICLLLAAAIGFILGWLLRGMGCKSLEAKLRSECDERIRFLESSSSRAGGTIDDGIGGSVGVNTLAGAGVAGSSAVNTVTGAGAAGSSASAANVVTGAVAGAAGIATAATAVAASRSTEVVDTVSSDLAPVDEYDIEEIEGIGPAIGKRLRGQGIATVGDLLRSAETVAHKQAIYDQLGLDNIDLTEIDRWVSMADLMQVPGVGSQYSELLEAAGVYSISDLKQVNAMDMVSRMRTANKANKITKHALPDESTVESWIEKALSL